MANIAPEKIVPPIPAKAPLVDRRGHISPAWFSFMHQLYLRAGGPIALTNIELEEQLDVSELEADIEALQTQFNNLGTISVADSLTKGRAL